MLRFLGESKMPIPLQAVREFKSTWIPGMIIRTFEEVESDDICSKPEEKWVTREVQAVYPNFLFTADHKAILYPDAMIKTGWWNRNKWRYFAIENRD